MKHLSRSVAVLSLLALFGAGCGSTPAAPSDANSYAPAAPTTQTPPSDSGNAMAGCSNLYYPLKAGSSIEYAMKNGTTADVPFTVSVVSHDANSIDLQYTFTVSGKQTTVTNELACVDGSIQGKGYFDASSALSGMNFKYETVSMKGDIIPKDLAVGKEWTLDSETVIHTDDARLKAIMDGKHQKTHAENKVVGEESVTVPAGTFDALKIHQTITIDTGIAGATITTETDSWYVKDVGLVKSETSGVGGTTSGMEATKITGQ